MNNLTQEQKQGALEVYAVVKDLEKEYHSQDNRTHEDIEGLYTDDYILAVWNSEGIYNEETGTGWNSFEEFLIDLIEQNLENEKHKRELWSN